MSESAGANVKDWLLNKCKDASLLLQAEHSSKQVISCRRYGSVVLTPSNIPQFQIPRNLDVKTRDDSDTHSQSSDSSLPCSGHTSPRLSPASREPTPNLLNKPTSPHSSRSAPVSPVRCNTNARLERFNTLAGEKVDMATNADPYSLAAMSLPHLKTFTNFGFETLRESPNTRRKESLFHNMHAENAHRAVPNRKSRSCDGSPLPFPPEDITVERRPSYKRRNVPSVVAPLGVLLPLSSNESNQTISPFSRSPSPRDSTSPRAADKVRFRFSPKKEKGRSVSPTTTRERIMMSGARRQSCGPRLLVEDADEPRKFVNNNNKHNALCKSLSMNSDFIDDQNIEDGMPISDDDYGIVDLVMQFNSNTKMLSVTIIQCKNLINKRPDLPILPFATVCLMPGKIQRQTLSLVPNASETFLFKDLSQDQFESLKLRIRLYNKVQGLRRKDFLGEAMIYLQDYKIMEPVHINCQLQDKERNNKSGSLEISLCFQASLEKLTVNIIQSKDLPRNSITGPPDAYVRVTLQQPGRPESRIQTKIRKKTQNPVYSEEHLMTISPRIEDLNYSKLTFTVYSRETIRSDEAIGQVRLGLGATEESEFTHWNNVLQNPGRDYTSWHTLMEADAFNKN